ncbi:hypothetical protein [Nocardia wallacei]|uniref:hypothetical protein n=1 Tax=Nocardia wallacei TaxID=480035 RepID=UPI002453AA70|nr:hypothetical protein [Nocardia wallacei]
MTTRSGKIRNSQNSGSRNVSYAELRDAVRLLLLLPTLSIVPLFIVSFTIVALLRIRAVTVELRNTGAAVHRFGPHAELRYRVGYG